MPREMYWKSRKIRTWVIRAQLNKDLEMSSSEFDENRRNWWDTGKISGPRLAAKPSFRQLARSEYISYFRRRMYCIELSARLPAELRFGRVYRVTRSVLRPFQWEWYRSSEFCSCFSHCLLHPRILWGLSFAPLPKNCTVKCPIFRICASLKKKL